MDFRDRDYAYADTSLNEPIEYQRAGAKREIPGSNIDKENR
jgi:hypothetical protein